MVVLDQRKIERNQQCKLEVMKAGLRSWCVNGSDKKNRIMILFCQGLLL